MDLGPNPDIAINILPPKTMLGKMRLSKMNVEYLLVSVGAPSALQCQIHMCLERTKLVYNKEWVQMHIATTVSFF